jgi:orotate phosphoribosyltransferase
MSWKKRSKGLQEMAEGLVKAGAIQFGTFTLPDGKDSSYYVNLRAIPGYPGAYSMATEAIKEVVRKKAPRADAFYGIFPTGLLLASPVAVSLRKPLVYSRLERTPGESRTEVEVMPDWRVAVVDDVATTGKTILSAAKDLEEEGGVVKEAVVLIDRLEGAREALSREGIALHAVTDIVELADTLFSMELVTEDNLKSITRSVGGSRRKKA